MQQCWHMGIINGRGKKSAKWQIIKIRSTFNKSKKFLWRQYGCLRGPTCSCIDRRFGNMTSLQTYFNPIRLIVEINWDPDGWDGGAARHFGSKIQLIRHNAFRKRTNLSKNPRTLAHDCVREILRHQTDFRGLSASWAIAQNFCWSRDCHLFVLSTAVLLIFIKAVDCGLRGNRKLLGWFSCD